MSAVGRTTTKRKRGVDDNMLCAEHTNEACAKPVTADRSLKHSSSSEEIAVYYSIIVQDLPS